MMDLMTEDHPTGFAHGGLGYLQVPATDIAASAAFYREVFGWDTDPDHRGFQAPMLPGEFATELSPSPDGLLLWLMVDGIDAALERVWANGGSVTVPLDTDPDGRWIATVRDPAGNSVGVVYIGAR